MHGAEANIHVTSVEEGPSMCPVARKVGWSGWLDFRVARRSKRGRGRYRNV